MLVGAVDRAPVEHVPVSPLDNSAATLNSFRMDRAPRNTLSCDNIVAKLRWHEGELRKLGITSISIFGSRARGDHRRDTDLDLLIDYDMSRKFSLVDLLHAERYIQELIGCPVHITTRSSIPATELLNIECEAVVVL